MRDGRLSVIGTGIPATVQATPIADVEMVSMFRSFVPNTRPGLVGYSF